MYGVCHKNEYKKFCTVSHPASANNYQLFNMNWYPGQDSSRQPQRLKASTFTATPPSPLDTHIGLNLDPCLPGAKQLCHPITECYFCLGLTLTCGNTQGLSQYGPAC